MLWNIQPGVQPAQFDIPGPPSSLHDLGPSELHNIILEGKKKCFFLLAGCQICTQLRVILQPRCIPEADENGRPVTRAPGGVPMVAWDA